MSDDDRLDSAPTLCPLPASPATPAAPGAVPQSGPKNLELLISAEFAGRYTTHGVLGQGGMGVVYRGVQKATGREVAIKFLLMASPRMVNRFQRERDLLARLRHPNIIEFLEAGENNGVPYLVMQLVRGTNLRDHMLRRGGRLPVEEALRIFMHVLDGMEYVHAQGTIHRDLKPANVFLTENGEVKVGDFGLAWSEHDGKLSSTGEMMGTASYMPPEQFAGPVKEPTADIYALGAMLYELLTGRLPIEEDSYTDYLLAHRLNKRPRPLSNLDTSLPRHLDDLVQAALDKNPDRRPRSVRQFRSYLQPPDERVDSNPVTDEIVSETGPDADPVVVDVRRRSDWLSAGILVAGLTLAGHFYTARVRAIPAWPVSRSSVARW